MSSLPPRAAAPIDPESNFPVDAQTLSYTVLWNAFQILADRYDDSEQASLFSETAARVYKLDLSGDREAGVR